MTITKFNSPLGGRHCHLKTWGARDDTARGSIYGVWGELTLEEELGLPGNLLLPGKQWILKGELVLFSFTHYWVQSTNHSIYFFTFLPFCSFFQVTWLLRQ